MKRICIVGGGFAGLAALQHLKEGLRGRRNVEVVLIDASATFDSSPLLSEVASGDLTPRAARVRLEGLVEHQRFQVTQTRITDLDLEGGAVVSDDRRIDFDHLLLAPGAEIDWCDLDDPDGKAIPWRRVEDASALSRRVLRAFGQAKAQAETGDPSRALTFVIAGAGASGVELAASLASSARSALLPRVDPALRRHFRVVLVEPQDTVLPAFRAETRAYAHGALLRLGVDLTLGDRVVGIDGEGVSLASGETIATDHLVWAGGVKARSWLRGSGLALDEDGLVLVRDDLSAIGAEEIYAVGDAVQRASGDPWPHTAWCASQQGPVAAGNILMDMIGSSTDPFEYFHWGNFVRLGDRDAVVEIGDYTLTGSLARSAARLGQLALAPTYTKRAALVTEWIDTVARGKEWSRLPILP